MASFPLQIAYQNQMVMDFGLTTSRNSTGFYTGILDSMSLIGRILGAPAWGYLTDHGGRKLNLVLSLIFLSSCTFMIGFSQSFLWVVIGRFGFGLLSGVQIASKAIVTEICTGSWQARLMTFYNTSFNFGIIIGVPIAGLLVAADISPIKEFPYLLPNLIYGLFGILASIIAMWLFQETLNPRKSFVQPSTTEAYGILMASPTIGRFVLLICLVCFMQGAMDVVLGSWMWADIDHGGLGLSTAQIGFVISIASILMESIQLFGYPAIVAMIGYDQLVVIETKLMVLVAVLFPGISYFDVLRMPLLVICCAIWHMLCIQLYSSLFILSNNSVRCELRGKLNGLAMALASSLKSTAPMLFGALFSWTLRANGSFLNAYSCFLLIGFLAVGMSMLVPSPKKSPLQEKLI